MPDQIRIFDPRHTFYMQGFTGRGATTTIHDATATGCAISGIFQAAEDFAVLGFYNAYDYFNHLRVKPLPRTDLSGLKLEFDLEYDHRLDGAMRFDAEKFASVAWDSVTFVCGAGGTENTYEVKLLEHAEQIGGGETPATCSFRANGTAAYFGVDYIHLHFRDTRYTVASLDCRKETQITAAITEPGLQWITVENSDGIAVGDYVYLERTGTNEELVRVEATMPGNAIRANVTQTHEEGSYVTLEVTAKHMAAKLAELVNTTAAELDGRFGPDQSGVITAGIDDIFETTATLQLSFLSKPLPAGRYGKLGNLDRVLVTSGHVALEEPLPEGYDVAFDVQGVSWSSGDGATRFTGGDNDTRYHVTLDFTQELRDKLNRVVPMNDCRKVYMVFAPRFEPIEEELEDGCFLAGAIGPADSNWTVEGGAALTGGRYFIGDAMTEERVLLRSAAPGQITVERGYEGSTAAAWPAGTRLKKVSALTGVRSDIEWSCTVSNLVVTGPAALKVGGASARIEEADRTCNYTGFWEPYKYGDVSWPTQWWSTGHARRAAPNDAGDIRKVSIRYSRSTVHDLYLGTFLYTNCGIISVTVDGGAPTTHDLYLAEFGGTTANVLLRSGLPAGNHTVEITATFGKNPASSGYYFYFDYLWPLVAGNVPDPPEVYGDVSLAIDFDTDHGYKKPPCWHIWHLKALGFEGHADVYMGVFWNNKRRRVEMSYPYATVEFSGEPSPGDVVSVTIAGTTLLHAIGYGETLQQIVSHFRAAINGMFAGVWADDNFGTSTTLRIQSKAPGYVFTGTTVSAPNSLTLTLSDHLATEGVAGDWEMVDSVSPVMTEGARQWIRDLAGQFRAAGIPASFAFSHECYRPPLDMAARYWDGQPVFLPVPSHQMHFGPRVRKYLKQMFRECADQIAAAGLPVVLQFGETQWWYFPNESGMPFYDTGTKDDFYARYNRPLHQFTSNTDDPAADQQSADFLRDRIWEYCREVLDYVRQAHPSAVFECLWPLDANQGKPNSPEFRRLNMHVNLPNEWKTSAYGIKYFRSEGFDYDVWQKNAGLVEQALSYPKTKLGRPPEECMFLSGIYGPPDPPMEASYLAWRSHKLYSFCFWAFDQFCLNSRAVPLPVGRAAAATASYHKPKAARAEPVAFEYTPIVAAAGGALNRYKANARKLND